MSEEEKYPSEDYKYGFKNDDVSILKTEKGLTEWNAQKNIQFYLTLWVYVPLGLWL